MRVGGGQARDSGLAAAVDLLARSGSITLFLIVFGVGGAVGNLIAGYTVTRSLRASFIVGGAGLVVSLLLLLTIGHGPVGTTISPVLWGLSLGVVQLSQVNMTLAAAPDTFEAAMSLNTMAYNTSIALGGLFADSLGVRSVVWFGVVLIAASLLIMLSTRRTTARVVRDEELVTTGQSSVHDGHPVSARRSPPLPGR